MSLSTRLLAPVYDRLVRPSEQACLGAWRRDLLSPLTGTVLEIGAGTGANLPHYGAGITHLVATEPDRHMRKRLQAALNTASMRGVELSDAAAEELPMADDQFDAVVSTLVLCSVKDQSRALAEYRRVLKPGGQLIFIEHVLARGNRDRLRWQRRVEPIWKRVFGGCHLTRDTEAAMELAGFRFERLDRQSMRKANPMVRPTIRGVARQRDRC